MGEGSAMVTIELDRPRMLRYDFAALCRLEDFGVELSELAGLAEEKRAKVVLIAQILAAGLTSDDYRPDPEDVIRLLDKMPGNLKDKMKTVTERIDEAFKLAMPEADEGNVGGSEEKDSTGEKSGSSDSVSSV